MRRGSLLCGPDESVLPPAQGAEPHMPLDDLPCPRVVHGRADAPRPVVAMHPLNGVEGAVEVEEVHVLRLELRVKCAWREAGRLERFIPPIDCRTAAA